MGGAKCVAHFVCLLTVFRGEEQLHECRAANDAGERALPCHEYPLDALVKHKVADGFEVVRLVDRDCGGGHDITGRLRHVFSNRVLILCKFVAVIEAPDADGPDIRLVWTYVLPHQVQLADDPEHGIIFADHRKSGNAVAP